MSRLVKPILKICGLLLMVLGMHAAHAQQASYIVKPGDTLEISVWKEPDLQRQVLVRPDGAFSFPLVGEVDARGKTVAELNKLVARRSKATRSTCWAR
jgi:polysaccharide export outer membrane protein